MYNSLKVAKSVDNVYRSGVSQYINVEFGYPINENVSFKVDIKNSFENTLKDFISKIQRFTTSIHLLKTESGETKYALTASDLNKLTEHYLNTHYQKYLIANNLTGSRTKLF
jgi:hypothetical protein